MLRIAGFEKGSSVDGPGVRNVVFLQGCAHGCPGCHNPETHSFGDGRKMKVQDVVEELVGGFERGEKPRITISGGDPFYQPTGLAELCRALKVRYGSEIWLYTGFLWEQLRDTRYSILRNVDVLIDGPFIEEKKTLETPFVGSSNQRLIDVVSSLMRGRLVLWEPEAESDSELVAEVVRLSE